jgi:hypothetical protein
MERRKKITEPVEIEPMSIYLERAKELKKHIKINKLSKLTIEDYGQLIGILEGNGFIPAQISA